MKYDDRPDYAAALTGLLERAGVSGPKEVCGRFFEAFGCYSGIFDAQASALAAIKGMTEEAAVLLKLFPELERRRRMAERPMPKLISDPALGNALAAVFYAGGEEYLTAVAAEASGRITGKLELRQNRRSEVELCISQIVDFAVSSGASVLVVAHNHPDGYAIPSAADNAFWIALRRVLAPLGISLFDQFVIAGGEYVSMRESAEIPGE